MGVRQKGSLRTTLIFIFDCSEHRLSLFKFLLTRHVKSSMNLSPDTCELDKRIRRISLRAQGQAGEYTSIHMKVVRDTASDSPGYFVMFPTFASQIKLNDKINGSVWFFFFFTHISGECAGGWEY